MMRGREVFAGIGKVILLLFAYIGMNAFFLYGVGADSLVTTIITDSFFFVALLAYLQSKRVRPWPKPDVRLTGGLVAGFVVLTFVAWLYGQFTGSLIYETMGDSAFDLYTQTQGSDVALAAIVIVIAAPLFEEVFFRGAIYGTLRRGMGIVPAALVSSAIFSLLHGTMVHLWFTFVLGLACCVAYEATGRLRWSMLIHFFANSSNLFIDSVDMPGVLVSWPFVLFVDAVCGALLVASLVYLAKRPKVLTVEMDMPRMAEERAIVAGEPAFIEYMEEDSHGKEEEEVRQEADDKRRAAAEDAGGESQG